MTDDETIIKTLDSDDTAFSETLAGMLRSGIAILKYRDNRSESTDRVKSVFDHD